MLMQREAALREAQNEAKVRRLEIERLKLQLAKARHETYGLIGTGQASRRAARTGDQRFPLAGAGVKISALVFSSACVSSRPWRWPRGPRKLPDNLPGEASSTQLRELAEDVAARGCASSVKSYPRRQSRLHWRS